eukprot:CAMPEP_0185270816 /NCGR_PEP_ID=MMETSP1359-20130426/43208_1 /TAXON_ID=552665 /ORGANISM="Bigelowiella longifila, Strain CCMP242" /LENGTH=158 /DNA_ID=CAMNT_0027862535 /DNA_START=378 /DNA_END=852 /DNA_ORIENTATION=-
MHQEGVVKKCLPSWSLTDGKQKTKTEFEKVDDISKEERRQHNIHNFTSPDEACFGYRTEIGRRGEGKVEQSTASVTVVPLLPNARNQDGHPTEGGQRGRRQQRREEGKAEDICFTLNSSDLKFYKTQETWIRVITAQSSCTAFMQHVLCILVSVVEEN